MKKNILSTNQAIDLKSRYQMVLKFLFTVFLLLCSTEAWGQIVTFTPTSTTGAVPSNVTSSNLTIGAGLSTGTNCSGSWYQGTTGSIFTSLSDAESGGDFYEFTITPNTGFKINLTSVSVSGLRASGTGPQSFEWGYKDGSSSFIYQGLATTPGSGNCASAGNTNSWDFPDFSSTNSVVFRIYIYNGTNIGGNYRMNVVSLSGSINAVAKTSIASGDWSNTATWGESAPTSTENAVITAGHVVTMNTITGGINTRNAGTTTVVDSGGTLATNVSYSNDGTTTINGTFQINNGGFGGGTTNFVYGAAGNLIFNHNSGNYYGDVTGIDSGHRYWPATNSPFNVSVNTNSPINLGVSRTVAGTFKTAAGVSLTSASLTLNGTAQINGGGSFNNSPIYGAASKLIYKTGGLFGRASEWNQGSGTIGSTAGYPQEVQLSGNTTLNYPNGTSGTFKTNGNLIIDSGSNFYQDYGGNAGLIVGGKLVLNGLLKLGSSIGGDIAVSGDWTQGSAATFNPNNRTVFFNGSSD